MTSRARAHCVNPDIAPEQKSTATSQTGRGIGDSQGCYKPENQRQCGIGPAGEPVPGSPLAEWEAKYGKLKTTVRLVRGPICGGHSTGMMTVVERIPDSSTLPEEKKRVRCCSIRYKACPTNC